MASIVLCCMRPILLLLVLLLTASTPASGEVSGQPTTDERHRAAELAKTKESAARFAAALLVETNRVRRAHGRLALKPLDELNAAADDQAAFMALTLHAQHASFIRGQQTPTERVRRHGLEGMAVSENVVNCPVGSDPEPPPVDRIAAMLVATWMDSPGHRANLLDRRFTHFGGSVRLVRLLDRQWCAFGVQVFFTPAGRGR